jgi:hypothetical protein
MTASGAKRSNTRAAAVGFFHSSKLRKGPRQRANEDHQAAFGGIRNAFISPMQVLAILG